LTRPLDLSAAEARAIALTAQGLCGRPVRKRAAAGDLLALIDRLGAVQLDSVNVVCRAHYLPFFARSGPYDRAALDACAWGGQPRQLFEYWGHEASLIPMRWQPLFRWRMERAARGEGMWRMLSRFAAERRAYVDEVLAEVLDRGPVRAGDLSSAERRSGTWWARSDAKNALEWLFWAGRVTIAARRHFERYYDVVERVVPPEVLAEPTPPRAAAQRELLLIAMRALGVASASDLRDYFRLPSRDVAPLVAELVADGAILPAEVEGWDEPAFVDARRTRVRVPRAEALLAPFDSLVWYRARAERLFGFHYRIEIYTPAPERRFGYYVLPFLLGDALVARVDVKAVRVEGVLSVPAAHLEAGVDAERVAVPLAGELTRLARWIGLDSVTIGKRGGLAKALRAACRRKQM
jgi:uncharacterized protein YcaQ